MTSTPTSASAAIPTAAGPSPTTARTAATDAQRSWTLSSSGSSPLCSSVPSMTGPLAAENVPSSRRRSGDDRRELLRLENVGVGEVAPGVAHREVARRCGADELVVGLGCDQRGHVDQVVVADPADARPDQGRVVEPVLLVLVDRLERADDVDRAGRRVRRLGRPGGPSRRAGAATCRRPRGRSARAPRPRARPRRP